MEFSRPTGAENRARPPTNKNTPDGCEDNTASRSDRVEGPPPGPLALNAVRLAAAVRALRRAPGVVQIIVVAADRAGPCRRLSLDLQSSASLLSSSFSSVSGTLFKTHPDLGEATTPIPSPAIFDTGDYHSPMLLAALAPQEVGQPRARTYWRWSWRMRPFEIYSNHLIDFRSAFQIGWNVCGRKNYLHPSTIKPSRKPALGTMGIQLVQRSFLRVVPIHALNSPPRIWTARCERARAASNQRRFDIGKTGAPVCGDPFVRVRGREICTWRLVFPFSSFPGHRCGDQDQRTYLARSMR